MSEGTFHLLILILVANGTPVLAARLMGGWAACPIDAGVTLWDGHPLFGHSKTWRGLILAAVVCAVVAPLLGYTFWIGLAAGLLAMSGDLLSSFSKRRLGLKSSAQAPLLDQIPEALLPAICLKGNFAISWLEIGAITVAFIFLEVIFSIIFYYLGVRKRPY